MCGHSTKGDAKLINFLHIKHKHALCQRLELTGSHTNEWTISYLDSIILNKITAIVKLQRVILVADINMML